MKKVHPLDYKDVLALFLPAGILDYFEITEASNMGSYYLIGLIEKDIIPEELATCLGIRRKKCKLS
ncbi:MAG: hypothetical protein LKH27_02840 [Prevotella sp.]|jgi:hypothetical protein|nr:hypothetical protein [Prevotella sp.]MCI1473326.1 hypothetical protein [Prevotella sp.]MCI1548951.1 hypothetical protein [Prevotella sp.]